MKHQTVEDAAGPEWDYGETAFTHTSPFRGSLVPGMDGHKSSFLIPMIFICFAGQALQALENNLYKAPAYRHQPPPTDFLLIRNRKGYFLRQVSFELKLITLMFQKI